jgi:hypothetical protein
MPRSPLGAHFCAENPVLWEAGFNFARLWTAKLAPAGKADAIYLTVKHSTNVPFPETAAEVGLQPTPFVEGFMLGVYGIKALETIGG